MVVKDDLLRIAGIKDELKHIDKELKTVSPELKKAARSTTANAAEDAVFVLSCCKIGMANTREYEERQLKVAQEETQARLQFDTQIARLTNPSGLETEGLIQAQSHLTQLDGIINAEQANLAKLQQQKAAAEQGIATSEPALENLKEELAMLEEMLEEKAKVVSR
ncbi:hypothetical protein NLJ89_g10927 [Agrocybe chaxingu]|uniref:Uncharacterized protein n=1 Tax=Agrocybe chaxingu TaxID=84603 RepID=A0A9W8JMV0_9AGAR|nr:hypothetical protein NLJ89_g10927 [Agrocybe chaxingu]